MKLCVRVCLPSETISVLFFQELMKHTVNPADKENLRSALDAMKVRELEVYGLGAIVTRMTRVRVLLDLTAHVNSSFKAMAQGQDKTKSICAFIQSHNSITGNTTTEDLLIK